MTSSKKTSSSKTKETTFAIAETSGRQVLFEINRYYDLNRIDAKEKDKITLENILLIKENDKISVGKPYIENAKIELEVISHKRDKKIIVYKMRPKKKTRRKMGHRQELTRVMVKSISVDNVAKSSTKSDKPKKTTSVKKKDSKS